MIVYLHDEAIIIDDMVHLEEFLSNQKILEKKGIAVAINNQVIPRNYWSSYLLKEEEHIVIIQATQGG